MMEAHSELHTVSIRADNSVEVPVNVVSGSLCPSRNTPSRGISQRLEHVRIVIDAIRTLPTTDKFRWLRR
jgi:hypothetical protein